MTDDTIIKVTSINNILCKLNALLDTGSPVSFISTRTFNQYLANNVSITPTPVAFKTVNGSPLKVKGLAQTTLKLELLPEFSISAKLNVLEEQVTSIDLIIGLDLLDQNDITAVKNPANKEKIQLFVELASTEIAETQNNKMLYYRIPELILMIPLKINYWN